MTEGGDTWFRWLKEERWGDHRAALESALADVRDRILGMATLQAGERVLDLGCGMGLLGLKAAELVGPGGLVVFLDVSRPSLATAEQSAGTGGRCAFLQATALNLPLPDHSLDSILIRSVLIYVRDKRAAARELARVLHPGERVALYEPINRRMDPIIDCTGFEDVAEAYARAKDMSPMTDFDENDLVAAFESAGFSVNLTMDESRWPARGKEWAHGFKHGAPGGYSGYDMLLMGGITRERADEFLAAGERQLGDEWRIMTCPAAYILAVSNDPSRPPLPAKAKESES